VTNGTKTTTKAAANTTTSITSKVTTAATDAVKGVAGSGECCQACTRIGTAWLWHSYATGEPGDMLFWIALLGFSGWHWTVRPMHNSSSNRL
jgi:hypothetical protein